MERILESVCVDFKLAIIMRKTQVFVEAYVLLSYCSLTTQGPEDEGAGRAPALLVACLKESGSDRTLRFSRRTQMVRYTDEVMLHNENEHSVGRWSSRMLR